MNPHAHAGVERSEGHDNDVDCDPHRLAAWLGLSARDGVGPRRLWDLMDVGLETEWLTVSDEADRRRALRQAQTHLASGITWSEHTDPAHPSVEVGDPHVPPVLLWRSASEPPARASAPRVGIVGTRRASRLGAEVAYELGRGCALAGITVVSGLATGIDAAAHRGALSVDGAAPLAVVGTGLDIAYPARNASLWAEIAARGALCSEYPLGTQPAPWRFPARNRILVAHSDVIVVVESSDRGGSLITAGIAGERGVPVLAVPGSIRSNTAVGTNRLLADGCQPCLGIDDIVMAVGLCPNADGRAVSTVDAGTAELTQHEAALLDALGWEATTVEALALRCPSLGLGELFVGVQSLVRRGVVSDHNGWLERVR